MRDDEAPRPGPGEPPEDFVNEPDVAGLHAPLRREPAEPEEGVEAPPWWLWAGVILSLFVGGFYLGRHSGPFAPVAHQGRFAETAGGTPEALQTPAPVDGKRVFNARCATCHQADGSGIPGSFPPIVGSETVTGDPDDIIKIVLYGLQGKITVKGVTYNGVMPGWKDQLSDEEVAAVITYERSMGDNQAGAVTAEQVKEIRAALGERGPMTATELKGGS